VLSVAAWAGVCATAVLAIGMGVPARAMADGDPASDVLASQPLFLPADGAFSVARAEQLRGLLASAQRRGFAIRVAVIATQADLGSVTELWRQPQNYADFLGQELAQVYRGMLLVVMPNGLGVAKVPNRGATGQQIGVAAPTRSLITTATSAVIGLAGAAGVHVSLPRAVASPGSGSALGSVDLGSWLALAVGLAVIAAAWRASLRARPLARLRRAR